jgi:TatD DNase family protein
MPVRNPMIDSHAHIYLDAFDDDLEAVLGRSREAGVQRIYMPNIDSGSIGAMLRLEERSEGFCRPMMGLHPCSVKEDYVQQLQLVEHWLEKRSFAAVGEIGTDLHWDDRYWEQQVGAFRRQVGLAVAHGLPVVIHCRKSMAETIALVSELRQPGLRGVFHCFSGSPEDARRIVEMGFYLGIGGVVTYKNSGLEEVLKATGIDPLLLETDSPYLAPVPHRGRRNEPAHLALIAGHIARITGRSVDDVIATTTSNCHNLFGDA